MGRRKGQGATEYMMVFGAALLIVLIAIVLFSFFNSLGADSRISDSANYWKNEARPIAITEYNGVAANGTFTVRLVNADAKERLTVTGVAVGNATTSIGGTPFSTVLGPGDSAVISLVEGQTGTAGELYDIGANITYSNAAGIPMAEYGSKNLVGRYS